MIDVKKVHIRDMKEMMRREIDKIGTEDAVDFAIVFEKYPGKQYGMRCVNITIDKRMKLEEDNDD